MNNRELGDPVEYEVIYKDRIVPAKRKPPKHQDPNYKESRKSYKGGFITMTVVSALLFLSLAGVSSYFLLTKTKPAPVTHLVQWKDDGEDGRIWQVQQVADGTKVKYEGEEPYKVADSEYTYKFNEWSDNESVIKEDTTFIARYLPFLQENKYSWDESTKSYSVVGSKTGENFDQLYVDRSKNNGREARVTSIGDGINPIDVPTTTAKISIPSFITTIEENAFDLKRDDFQVIFEDKEHSQLKTIKKEAFKGYPQTSIDLPDSVEVIEGVNRSEEGGQYGGKAGAFYQSKLTFFKYPESLTVIEPIFFSSEITTEVGTGDVETPQDIKIGKNVKEIKKLSIFLSKATRMFIPLNVLNIEDWGLYIYSAEGKDRQILINCGAPAEPSGWTGAWYANPMGAKVDVKFGATS